MFMGRPRSRWPMRASSSCPRSRSQASATSTTTMWAYAKPLPCFGANEPECELGRITSTCFRSILRNTRSAFDNISSDSHVRNCTLYYSVLLNLVSWVTDGQFPWGGGDKLVKAQCGLEPGMKLANVFYSLYHIMLVTHRSLWGSIFCHKTFVALYRP